MDYMGLLPETGRGNKHILVVVDHFTKWCEKFATPDQKASTVAPLLVSRILSRFGPPSVLHSNQGRNFESTLLHEICNFMGITKRAPRATILSVIGKLSGKTELFRLCFQLLFQIEEMTGTCGWIQLRLLTIQVDMTH
jgi:hypothetical protein